MPIKKKIKRKRKPKPKSSPTQKQKQQIIINLGGRAPPKRKRVAKKQISTRQTQIQTPQPQTRMLPNFSTGSEPNTPSQHDIQKMWAQMSDLQRDTHRGIVEARRLFGVMGATEPIRNPKRRVLVDTELSSVSKSGEGSSVEDERLPPAVARRKEVISRRRSREKHRKRDSKGGRGNVLEEKVRLSNREESEIKNQEQNPPPSRFGAIRDLYNKMRAGGGKAPAGGGKAPAGGGGVEDLTRAQLLSLRSPDYYEGKKSGTEDETLRVNRNVRRGLSQLQQRLKPPAQRSQVGLQRNLQQMADQFAEGKSSDSFEGLAQPLARGRVSGSRNRIIIPTPFGASSDAFEDVRSHQMGARERDEFGSDS